MKFLILSLAFLSFSAFAEKMGPEAIEMYNVLNHHQVQECLKDAPSKMVNINIEKSTFRCPGCVEYKISGNELAIDVPRTQKTVISIKGKAVPGTFRGFIQTYDCSIKN